MIISKDAQKAFKKNSTIFHDQGMQQNRKTRKLPQHNKGHI